VWLHLLCPVRETQGEYVSYPNAGIGDIGQALTKAFARNGIDVSVATTCENEVINLIGHTVQTASTKSLETPRSLILISGF